jgi:hypothetical protein
VVGGFSTNFQLLADFLQVLAREPKLYIVDFLGLPSFDQLLKFVQASNLK